MGYSCPPSHNSSEENLILSYLNAAKKAEDETMGAESETASKPAENPTVEESAKFSAAEELPPSPASSSNDDSFVDDAEGSLAGAIGRTLDVCVQAIEDAIVDGNKPTDGSNEDAMATTASDIFSVASSVFTGVSEVPKVAEDAKKVSDKGKSVDDVKVEDVRKSETASKPAGNPTVEESAKSSAAEELPSSPASSSRHSEEEEEDSVEYTGWTEDDVKAESVDGVKVEDVASDDEEWSIVSDKKAQAKDAATVGTLNVEEEKDLSILGAEPLSPVLTAKWDTELRRLHGLGFLDDRKNIDALAHLEAAHLGCNSEEISIDSVVGHLLDA